MSIVASTWYRDSHGLFDYEEKQKLTVSNMKVKDNCKLHGHWLLSFYIDKVNKFTEFLMSNYYLNSRPEEA